MISKFRTRTKTKAKVKHRSSLAFRSSKQQGFTLIELLVVVSILAALAGITSVAMDGYQQDAEETITRVEMQRIANAIRRFKADTGYWPKTEVDGGTEIGAANNAVNYGGFDTANFNFLFNKPDEDMQDWSPEYAIGWHGPYINLDAMRTIALDSISNDGCDGATNAVIAGLTQFSYGLVDRFQQIRERNTGKDYCILTRDQKNMSEFKVAEYSASPYLYDADYYKTGNILCPDSSNKCVVLRSFGSDGIDDEGIDSSDDIVFVLAQKS